MRALTTTAVMLLLAIGPAGCVAATPAPVGPSPGGTPSSPAATPDVTPPSPPAATGPLPTASASKDAKPLTGRLIVVDPGHNGVWTRRELRKVPSGNGRTKPCNSSGTATDAGYPEHAYTWAQATALAGELRARGAEVLLTRPDDRGEGPCVNLRPKLANDRKADALVSVHADGSYARGARGFHVIVSTTMAGGARVERASAALARQLRRALEEETAMPRSTYIGAGTALSFRSDLGTLNLSERPGVMLEMGNMRNPRDAALLGSASFRAKAARAIADGLAAALG